MKREKVVTKRERVVEWRCDVCGKRAKYSCQVCGSDLCDQHCIQTDSWAYDMTHPHFDGDYPNLRICERCWSEGEPERSKITQLNRDHEKKKTDLLNAWYARAGSRKA